jgi:hypothetical protein
MIGNGRVLNIHLITMEMKKNVHWIFFKIMLFEEDPGVPNKGEFEQATEM